MSVGANAILFLSRTSLINRDSNSGACSMFIVTLVFWVDGRFSPVPEPTRPIVVSDVGTDKIQWRNCRLAILRASASFMLEEADAWPPGVHSVGLPLSW